MLASPINGEREQPGGTVFRVRLGGRAPGGWKFRIPPGTGGSRRAHVGFWRRSVSSVRDEKDRIMGKLLISEEENEVVPERG